MIYSSIISFYIPAIILTGTYVKIFRKIRIHSRTNARWQATHRRKGGLPGIPAPMPQNDHQMAEGEENDQNANLRALVLHRLAAKSLSFPVPEKRGGKLRRKFVNNSAIGFCDNNRNFSDSSDSDDSEDPSSPIAQVHHSRSEAENDKLLVSNNIAYKNNNNIPSPRDHSDSDPSASPTTPVEPKANDTVADTATKMFKKLADATSVLQNQTRTATISKEHKATNLVAIILGKWSH